MFLQIFMNYLLGIIIELLCIEFINRIPTPLICRGGADGVRIT